VGRGTGLGLATVHGIVSQSQGHIWADPKTDGASGTTFVVLLPLANRPSPVDGRPAPSPAGVARPARVLVVDDEEIVRRIVSRTLQAEGWQVLQAEDGREALDCLEREGGAVDLVVSDVVMPTVSGGGLSEALSRIYPRIPVVWMSGYPRDSAFSGGSVADTQPFLQKPVPSDVLVTTVRDLLARKPAASSV